MTEKWKILDIQTILMINLHSPALYEKDQSSMQQNLTA